MTRVSLYGLLAFIIMPAVAAQAATHASVEEFVQKAAAGNQFEIDSSKLAADHASSGKVKDFARQMIGDHTKAGADMKVALAKAGKDKTPDMTPDDKQRKMLDNLAAAKGAAFDKEYAKAQADAHDETVTLFEDYVKNGDEPNLKAFAEKTLPTLKAHQKMAKELP